MHLRDPLFPPLFRGHGIRAPSRPFPEAVAGAREGRYGAGDVIWARNTRLMDVAVVLEPEVASERVFEVVCIAAVAAGDAIGALAPPETAITWNWPNVLNANGARFGELRFAVSPELDAEGAPLWLVVGIELAVSPNPDGPEPGLYLDRTTLYDEGCIELDRSDVIEAWTRHFLVWLNTWVDEGFGPVHEHYLERAGGYREEIEIGYDGATLSGSFIGLDDHGHLILKTGEGTRLLHMGRAFGLGGERAGGLP